MKPTRLRLALFGVGLAAAALLLVGCFFDTVTGPTTIVTQTQGGPSPSPSVPPGTPGVCAPVAVVAVTAHLGGTGGQAVTSFSAKETVTLDATPKDGLGDKLDPACHGASVSWATSRSDCSITGATTGFNPDLTCAAEGSVTITAVVSQPGGVGTASLTVLP